MAAVLGIPAAIAAWIAIQGALNKLYRRRSKWNVFIIGALAQDCGIHVKRYGDKRDGPIEDLNHSLSPVGEKHVVSTSLLDVSTPCCSPLR